MIIPIPAPTKYTDPPIFLRGGEDLESGPELGAISEMDDALDLRPTIRAQAASVASTTTRSTASQNVDMPKRPAIDGNCTKRSGNCQN